MTFEDWFASNYSMNDLSKLSDESRKRAETEYGEYLQRSPHFNGASAHYRGATKPDDNWIQAFFR